MTAARLSVVSFAIACAGQTSLTTQEERGRIIYQEGRSLSGQAVTANVAGGDSVPGTVLPCSNCHGINGQGKPEAGIVPPNITWNTLTKPGDTREGSGRSHPPYNERLVTRAVTMGVDSGGNRLNGAMPLYRLSLADSLDLVAYIKRIGHVREVGVDSAVVRLGVILPPPDGVRGRDRIMRQALPRYFARVNAAGGIFGRRIDLAFEQPLGNRNAKAAAVRDFIAKQQIFAIVCGDFTGAEAEIGDILREIGAPAIAAFAAFPQAGPPVNPTVFYLDGGAPDDAAMVFSIVERRLSHAGASVAVVAAPNEDSLATAGWLQTEFAKNGRRALTVSKDPERQPTADLVLWLRSDPPPMRQASDGHRTEYLIPQFFADLDPATATRADWNRITAAAEIIDDAMKRTGHDLTRGALIKALEGFYQVDTSFGRPLSFGPDRRVGSSNGQAMVLNQGSGKLDSIK